MIDKLYIFANMGHLNELPKSGGQSSSRRVMKGLQKSGFDIVPIRRHRNELEGRWKHKLEALTFALIDPCKIVTKMMIGNRKGAAFLHLTYAGPLVPYELFLTLLVKMMGYKSLIYMKGGQVLDFYANGSKWHRWMFKKTMDLQSKVFFEGMESLKLVSGISNTPLVYFPNYVFDEQILDVVPDKPKDRFNILYFGRIAPNKNIHVILDVFEMLCQQHSNVYLTLIGGIGQSKAYAEMIDRRIEESPYRSKITRMGITPFETIKEIMRTQHFFLFPSKERAEGHSNSLNEAMSQGVIPIVSDYHFNRSIVGDDNLVVKGYEAKDYADRVRCLIRQGDIKTLSEQVNRRTKDTFSYHVVNRQIVMEIKAL